MSSCEFNFTDRPGPQRSSTIQDSKKHKAYLCTYRVQENKINGITLKEIFGEKEYYLDAGFFSRFHVSDSSAQLIIISKERFSEQYSGYGEDWEIEGFKQKGSTRIYQDSLQPDLPDSISLKVVSLKDKDRKILQELTLYKVY